MKSIEGCHHDMHMIVHNRERVELVTDTVKVAKDLDDNFTLVPLEVGDAPLHAPGHEVGCTFASCVGHAALVETISHLPA